MAAVTHCALFFFPIDEEEVEHKAPERIRDGTEERILNAESMVAALKMLVDVLLADGDVRRTAALREESTRRIECRMWKKSLTPKIERQKMCLQTTVSKKKKKKMMIQRWLLAITQFDVFKRA